MPPPVRQRYNAKARASTAGGASHKKRRRSGKSDEPKDEARVDQSDDGESEIAAGSRLSRADVRDPRALSRLT